MKIKGNKDKELYSSTLKELKSTKEKQERLKIIQKIIKIKDPWASEVLLDALDEHCEATRELIINELGNRENLDLSKTFQKLSFSPWFVKSAFIKILALQKNPKSIIYIETLINEPNADVRRTAAQTLGKIKGEEALSLLLKLSKDKNYFVRMSAEKSLKISVNLKFS